jgi:hypothetical protein
MSGGLHRVWGLLVLFARWNTSANNGESCVIVFAFYYRFSNVQNQASGKDRMRDTMESAMFFFFKIRKRVVYRVEANERNLLD